MNNEEMLTKLKEYASQLPKYGIDDETYSSQGEELVDLYDQKAKYEKEINELRAKLSDPKNYEALTLVVEQNKAIYKDQKFIYNQLIGLKKELEDLTKNYSETTLVGVSQEKIDLIDKLYREKSEDLRTKIEKYEKELTPEGKKLSIDDLNNMIKDADEKMNKVSSRDDAKYNADQARLDHLLNLNKTLSKNEVFLTYDYSKELNSIISDLESGKINASDVSDRLKEYKKYLPAGYYEKVELAKQESLKDIMADEQKYSDEIAELNLKLTNNANYVYGENPINRLAQQTAFVNYTSFEKEISDSEAEIEKINSKIENYKKSLESIKQNLANPTSGTNINKLNEDKDSIEGSINALNMSLVAYKNKKEFDQKSYNSAKAEYDNLNKLNSDPNAIDENEINNDKNKIVKLNEMISELAKRKSQINNDVIKQLDSLINVKTLDNNQATDVKSSTFTPNMKDSNVVGSFSNGDNVVIDNNQQTNEDENLKKPNANVETGDKNESDDLDVNDVNNDLAKQLNDAKAAAREVAAGNSEVENVTDFTSASPEQVQEGKGILNGFKNFFSKIKNSSLKKRIIAGVLAVGMVLGASSVLSYFSSKNNNPSNDSNINGMNSNIEQRLHGEKDDPAYENEDENSNENEEENINEEENVEDNSNENTYAAPSSNQSSVDNGSNSQGSGESSNVISETETVVEDKKPEIDPNSIPTDTTIHQDKIDETAGNGQAPGSDPIVTISGGEEINTTDENTDKKEVNPEGEDKGSEDKGSEDKGSEDKGSEDKGSEDKGSEDKGSSGSSDEIIEDNPKYPPGFDPATGTFKDEGVSTTPVEDNKETQAPSNPQKPGPVVKKENVENPDTNVNTSQVNSKIEAKQSEQELEDISNLLKENQLENKVDENTMGGK